MSDTFFVRVSAIQRTAVNNEEMIEFISQHGDTPMNWNLLQRIYPGEWLVSIPGFVEMMIMKTDHLELVDNF